MAPIERPGELASAVRDAVHACQPRLDAESDGTWWARVACRVVFDSDGNLVIGPDEARKIWQQVCCLEVWP